MLFFAIVTLLAVTGRFVSAGWNLRPLEEYSSIVSIEQRSYNKEVTVIAVNDENVLENLTSMDQGASWKKTVIPKQDYTMSNNEKKDRLNFENLPFQFVSKSIDTYGEDGIAITGRFQYLHSDDMFNGIALKTDITSNSWRVFSLSTNITEADDLLFATHSSFPTKETWYTVLSTIPTEKQKTSTTSSNPSSTSFLQFNVKSGEFSPVPHPLSANKQDSLASEKQFLAVYKTSSSGNDWDKVLEVKDDFKSYMRDFQCFDDITCITLIQRLDNTAVVLMTKDGGKTWLEIFRNEDAGRELKSVHLEERDKVWVVGSVKSEGEGEGEGKKKESVLLHSVDGGMSWNMINAEIEGLEKIFFYSRGVGGRDDNNNNYRYLEGLIVVKTKEGKQLFQQIVPLSSSIN